MTLPAGRGAGESGCEAKSALSDNYTHAHGEAERRLKAGARQGRCLTCKLWRWADEPCSLATFAKGKAPKPESSQ